MSIDIRRLEAAAAQAEEAAVELVRQGRLDHAIRVILGMLREALKEGLAPLVENVNRLTADVAELRESTASLERSVRELRWGLEREVELRRRLEGDVGRLRGEVSHMKLGGNLAYWCGKHGLDFEWLPRGPFRVDAVITGRHVIALVEMDTTGDEADVEQLLEGAEIYGRERGERPNALVLYIGVRPSSELAEECEEHGIILDNSPRRIAIKLAELDEELAESGRPSPEE